MRIWWVNQHAVAPDRPGGTRHHEMASALARRGHDVVVLASDFQKSPGTYTRRRDHRDRRHLCEVEDGVPFVWLPAGSFQRNDWRRAASMLVFSAHVGIHLVRKVRRGDVVIGSSPHLPGAFVAWAVARLRGARSIHEVRDLWPESLVAVAGTTTALTPVLRSIARLLYRRSDAIIVLAQGSRRPIIDHGADPANIHWIPNGVTIASSSTQAPEDLEWVGQHPTFVYAGAHGPANGLDFVLDVGSRLRRSHDDVSSRIRILLVGDGVERSRLVKRVEDEGLRNVVMHTSIPKSRVPALLELATGGLMVLKDVPLFRFGVSPNKLYDYLAADLPVVTNVAGEVADTVAMSGGGIPVDPGDVAGFADAMRRIASEGWPSGRGPAYIRQHHDRARLAERLEAVVRSVVERPS